MFPHKSTAQGSQEQPPRPPKRVRVVLHEGHTRRYPPQRLDHEGHVRDVEKFARQCPAPRTSREGGKA